jgi:hypothetical protein
MIVAYQLALAASAKRLSDVYGGTAGVPDETKNVTFRQVLLTAAGADVFIGGSGVTAATGAKVALTALLPLSIGPFNSGAVKLSDLYAAGAGATVNIVGVPF